MKKDWDILNEKNRQGLIKDNLCTPDGYFESMESSILQRIRLKDDPSVMFFSEQENQLLALAKITSIDQGSQDSFQVPKNYFESSAKEILQSIQEPEKKKGRVYRLKPYIWSSIAASVAVLLTIYWLQKPSTPNANFSQLLAEVDLDENDLEWIGDADDLAEYYLNLEDAALQDSVIPDSLNQVVTPNDSIPALPKQQNTTKVIPPKKLDWDQLTDEDIMDYLMESGDIEDWIEQ
ncbi:MAG: hypothetical protein RLZZ262_2100 [Bacteroidota bacterium]|jgi:hypothetical protein